MATDEVTRRGQAIPESTNILVFGTDIEGRINEWAQSAELVTGFPSDEVLGRSVLDSVVAPQFHQPFADFMECLGDGIASECLELELQTRSSGQISAMFDVALHPGQAGQESKIIFTGLDITWHKRLEANYRHLANDLAHLFGAPFFEAVSRNLAQATDLDYVFVGRLDAGEGEITILGGTALGRRMKPFNYALEGTPCANVIGSETCIYSSGVAARFPADDILADLGIEGYCGIPITDKREQPLGILVVLHRQPLKNVADIRQLLEIYSDRVAAEMERAQAEQSLRDSEARFRTILETVPECVKVVDADGTLLEMNPAGLRMIEAESIDAVRGLSVLDLVTPEYHASFQQGLKEVVQGRKDTRSFEIVDFKGDRHWMEQYAVPILENESENGVAKMLAVTRDITERQKEEERIRSEEVHFRSLFDHSGDALMTLENGRFTGCNEAAIKLFGASSKTEFVGRAPSYFSPPHQANGKPSKEEADRNIQQALSSGSHRFEWIHKRNGEHFHADVMLKLMPSNSGKRIVHGVVRDITERKQAEQDRERVANDLTQLIDTANAPIFGIDAQGLVTEWNQSAERITGYSKGDVMGQPLVAKFITEDYREAVSEVFDNALNGTETDNFEFPLYTKDGERVEVLLNATTRRDATGEVVGVVGVGQDIAERKQAEDALSRERSNLEKTVSARTSELRQSLEQLEISNQRLEEADRHKSRFLSTMSHELRTPLNAILGFTDLLDGQFFGDLNEKQHNYVSQIDGSGKHLLALINDLLDVAKIDAGAIDLEFDVVDISQAISGVVNMMAAQFRQKSLHVESHIEPGLPHVLMDVRRGRQILLNILSNAHKYTPEGGLIEISVTNGDNNCAHIAVSDSGIGLEPEHEANVFSEFYQADRARDEKLGGTGIGLALTRRLVEIHNGQIGVNCPAVFKHNEISEGTHGSTFWFTLPLANQSGAEQMDHGKRAGKSQLNQPPEILVAEDNETNLSMILEMLSVEGHLVKIARNGVEAVSLAEQSGNSFKLILMDINMPNMDGMEATQRIRKMKKYGQVPIVAVTAAVDRKSREDHLKAGCSDHLSKPLQVKDLLNTVSKHLQKNPSK